MINLLLRIFLIGVHAQEVLHAYIPFQNPMILFSTNYLYSQTVALEIRYKIPT